MAFPTSPSDGDRYTTGFGTVYEYDSTDDKWFLVNEALNIVYDTSPQLGGDLDLNGNSIDFPTTANIDDVIDDDTFATADANNLATAESIKAFVEAAGGGTLRPVPMYINPIAGFVYNTYRISVVNSDTNAALYWSFLCPKTANYKFMMCTFSDVVLTNSGKLTAGEQTQGVLVSLNNRWNALDMDLVHSAINRVYYTTSSTAISLTEGKVLFGNWRKDANDGSGTLSIIGLWLVEQ